MQQDVLICVNSRLDFFEKYYSVPEDLKPEVDTFIAQLKDLGERSPDATSFSYAPLETGLPQLGQ